MYEMAKDKNVLSSDKPRYEIFEFVRSDGQRIPREKTDKLVSLSEEILNRHANRVEKNAYDGSFGNYFSKK